MSFYLSYKKLNPHFPPETFSCAERTVDQLLTNSSTSERPGMLLGKVQSGKTRTFISILTLAFDKGYDIAIVLTKNSVALTAQTTKRLNSELARFIDDGELDVYDIMCAPETFERNELESKLIFVSKKQPDNLRRLSSLFCDGCPQMAEKRVLIIDDEADNASVGYTSKQGIIEANRVALQISDLRNVIKNLSFLQVTATPYSLYLQPTDVTVANSSGFSPVRPAFTELVPAPFDYVGGDTYFGDLARSDEDTLESLIHNTFDHNEFNRLKKPDRRVFKTEDILTTPAIEGYRKAIVTFIVGACLQRINRIAAGEKDKKLKYAFLLHSEAGKSAHNWQAQLTVAIKGKLETAVLNRNPIFEDLVLSAYNDLKRSVVLDGKIPPHFNEVLRDARAAFRDGQITIKKINSEEEVPALLDNSGQIKLSNYFNIFIGGQCIDRGVTISNLIGFYYGRRPNRFQQDTVLQHSRMYGYRREDLGVTRFYTSAPIRDAMFQMHEFDSTLRSTIETAKTNGTSLEVQFCQRSVKVYHLWSN